MKPYVLGIDIDGVLTEKEQDIWHDHLCRHIGREVYRKPHVYNIYEAYDLPQDLIQSFLQDSMETIYEDLKPAEGAVEVLAELERLGFQIVLITAREQRFHEYTRTWLLKHGFSFHHLFHAHDKVPIAREQGVQLFIEDYAHNAKMLVQAEIPTILMDREHNRHLEMNGNLYRLKDWQEVHSFMYRYFSLE